MAIGSTNLPGDWPEFPALPTLEQGQRLARDEFERRYLLRPDLKKAELIEGVVQMPSPVRIERHSTPHAAIMGWLVFYWAFTPGVQAADNGAVRLDLGNEPQPDGFLFIKPECGGRVRISSDDYVEGSPELMVEVSASTVSTDLNDRFRAYERNEVQEYIVWRVPERAIDWFVLRDGYFQPLSPDSLGCYRSEAFPGLWLAAQHMIHWDLPAVLQVLQQGLASPGHAAFVARLQSASSSSSSQP